MNKKSRQLLFAQSRVNSIELFARSRANSTELFVRDRLNSTEPRSELFTWLLSDAVGMCVHIDPLLWHTSSGCDQCVRACGKYNGYVTKFGHVSPRIHHACTCIFSAMDC